jgi:alpha-amylase/alpha-mannosidase (GH57 family)
MPRLGVAFLWHMHQPCYREPDGRVFRLPWARLHGLKDYADMPELAMSRPGLRLSFNLVPALVEQLEAYAKGTASDRHLELTRRPAGDLSEEEACFLLQEFFMANWENMIRPRPRYWELLSKRGTYFHTSSLASVLRRFGRQDLLDLQVWFNLAWTDPTHLEGDPVLAELCQKGRGFSEEDKAAMLERQAAILASVVPAYRKAAESGVAELSTSPFYHPILPLLCDSDAARECMPQSPLPGRFAFPEDAAGQVERALDFMEERFGARPRGIWPSEGSVSRETVDMLRDKGVEWLATDEGILERSLGRPLRSNLEVSDAAELYRPFKLGSGGPAIFFRDRVLSDLIGFTYSSWKPEEAAADFVSRLERIADGLGGRAGGHIVPVILDGENAWESYPDDGRPFLEILYRKLLASRKLRTCTFSEFLESGPEFGSLERLHSGSWINSDFGIWIGQREDNAAWELLRQAREAFEERKHSLDDDARVQAREELYIAEGSDWCWWYGGNFASEHLQEFDRLFRSHIVKAYRLMGLPVPEEALRPIATYRPSERLLTEPIELVSPVVDGRSTDYYEWAGAGKIDTAVMGGTMHRSQSLIKALYYGFNEKNLYLRLDPAGVLDRESYPELRAAVEAVKPALKTLKTGVLWEKSEERGLAWAFDKIIEVSVPFGDLDAKPGDEIFFQVSVHNNSLELEKHPATEAIRITVPNGDYLINNWQA